jgi:hypothetical protein
MENISEQAVLNYFKARNNRFCNTLGMEFGLGNVNDIWTEFNLSNYEHGPLAIDISTEGDGPYEFIEGFKLKKIEDVNQLGYTNSWMRYLNGYAEISVTPMELEATLRFKIVRRKTIVFSLDLHFYDEVYEHLTMPEDFENYISTHERRLQAANENRYKLNRK